MPHPPWRDRDRGGARWPSLQQRRARQCLRTQVGTIRGPVNTSTGELALTSASMMDVTPANRRQGSIWFA